MRPQRACGRLPALMVATATAARPKRRSFSVTSSGISLASASCTSWTRENCKEGFDKNPPEVQKTPEQVPSGRGLPARMQDIPHRDAPCR